MIPIGIAMVFIVKGKAQEHRQWITRSFAVALVYLEGRVIGAVTRCTRKGFPGKSSSSEWIVGKQVPRRRDENATS